MAYIPNDPCLVCSLIRVIDGREKISLRVAVGAKNFQGAWDACTHAPSMIELVAIMHARSAAYTACVLVRNALPLAGAHESIPKTTIGLAESVLARRLSRRDAMRNLRLTDEYIARKEYDVSFDSSAHHVAMAATDALRAALGAMDVRHCAYGVVCNLLAAQESSDLRNAHRIARGGAPLYKWTPDRLPDEIRSVISTAPYVKPLIEDYLEQEPCR